MAPNRGLRTRVIHPFRPSFRVRIWLTTVCLVWLLVQVQAVLAAQSAGVGGQAQLQKQPQQPQSQQLQSQPQQQQQQQRQQPEPVPPVLDSTAVTPEPLPGGAASPSLAGMPDPFLNDDDIDDDVPDGVVSREAGIARNRICRGTSADAPCVSIRCGTGRCCNISPLVQSALEGGSAGVKFGPVDIGLTCAMFRYRNCNGGRVAANTAAFGFTRVSATSVGWVPASFQCEPRFRLFRGLRRVVVVPTPDYFMGPVE